MKALKCMLHIIILAGNTLSKKIFIKLRGQSLNTDDPFHAAKSHPTIIHILHDLTASGTVN